MSLRLPRSPRLGLAATTVLLAAAVAGCGSDDDEPTTSTGAATTATGPASTAATTATGGSGAPAEDEAAIRAAIARGPAAVQEAKTARITIDMQNAGIKTKGTGTVELTSERYAMKQTLGEGGPEIENYGEEGKVYIRTAGQSWQVTENPVQGNDPLAQIRQLEKAKILRVRETAEFDGTTCRWFDAEVTLKDVLGNVRDSSARQLLEAAPDDAAIPVSSCVDDRGLTYAVDQEFDLGKVLGDAAGGASGTSVTKVRMSDYGNAPTPERPAGIDDAKPISLGSPDAAATN